MFKRTTRVGLLRITTVVAMAAALLAPRPAGASSLLEIYDLALTNDPAVLTAHTQTLIGQREFRDALYGYFPRLNGRLDYDKRDQNIISSDNTVFNIGRAQYPVQQALVEMRQPIIDYGRLMRVRKGDALRAKSFAEYANGRQELILRVCDVYFKALVALQRVELVEAARRAIQNELRYVRERSAAGQVPRSDLKDVEAQAQLALSELVDAQNAYRDRLEAITELTGSPVQRVNRIARRIPLERPNPPTAQQWVEMAGGRNHELQAQQLVMDAAKYRRDETLGDHLPNLEFTGTYDYTDQAGSRFGGGSVTSDMTVGLRLNVPIFNQDGRGYTYVKENHQVTLEGLKLDQLRRKIAREIKDSFNTTVGATRKYEALAQAVEATRVRLVELQEKNRSGEVTSIDVLKAQRDLVRAQRDQFDALVDYVLSTVRLKSRAGVLSEHDIFHLNGYLGQTAQSARVR